MATGRRMVAGALVLIALFWGFTVKAARQGATLTDSIARTIPASPEAIVYTKQRLQLTGTGSRLPRCPAAWVTGGFAT